MGCTLGFAIFFLSNGLMAIKSTTLLQRVLQRRERGPSKPSLPRRLSSHFGSLRAPRRAVGAGLFFVWGGSVILGKLGTLARARKDRDSFQAAPVLLPPPSSERACEQQVLSRHNETVALAC